MLRREQDKGTKGMRRREEGKAMVEVGDPDERRRPVPRGMGEGAKEHHAESPRITDHESLN